MNKLKAQCFKIPIESFLERASLSKPTPIPRVATQNKIKEAITIRGKTSVQELEPGTAGSHENPPSITSSQPTQRKSKGIFLMQETQLNEQFLGAEGFTLGNLAARLQ